LSRGSLALAFGCGVLALACNGILGLQEPTVDDTINGEAGADVTPLDSPADVPQQDGGTGPLVSARVRHIAVDDTYVYFTTPLAPSTIGKVAKDGSAQAITLAGDVVAGSHADHIVVDDTNAYWSTVSGVRQCPKTDCANVIALVPETSPYSPYDVIVDATNVYFLDETNGSAIRSVPKGVASGTVTTLAPESALCPTVNALRLSAGYLYFTCDEGPIGRVALVNGTVEILSDASAPTSAFGLAVTSSTVFYTLFTQPGAIMSVPSTGTDAGTKIETSAVAYGLNIDADATHVYWSAIGAAQDFSKGTITRCAIGTCDTTQEDLVSSIHGPADVHLDGAVLFYSVFGFGPNEGEGIYRLVLP
jgi:hypothetical protein